MQREIIELIRPPLRGVCLWLKIVFQHVRACADQTGASSRLANPGRGRTSHRVQQSRDVPGGVVFTRMFAGMGWWWWSGECRQSLDAATITTPRLMAVPRPWPALALIIVVG